MKKPALIALAALATAHAAPTRTATEGYVDRTVSAATNGLADKAEVDAKVENAVVKDAENVVTGAFSIKRTFEGEEQSLSFGGYDPSGPSIVVNKLYSTAPSSFFSGSIALIP